MTSLTDEQIERFVANRPDMAQAMHHDIIPLGAFISFARAIESAIQASPIPEPPDVQDAKRYRKWREGYTCNLPTEPAMMLAIADAWTAEELDAAIDEALATPELGEDK